MVGEMLDVLLAAHLCDHFGEDILAGSAEDGYGAPKAGSLLVVRLLIGRTVERGQDRIRGHIRCWPLTHCAACPFSHFEDDGRVRKPACPGRTDERRVGRGQRSKSSFDGPPRPAQSVLAAG